VIVNHHKRNRYELSSARTMDDPQDEAPASCGWDEKVAAIVASAMGLLSLAVTRGQRELVAA
jgi:hypothetical protein